MTNYLSASEEAIARLFDEDPHLFTNGITDWNKLRTYYIQRCVEQNYKDNIANPIASACMANNVHRNYYAKNFVFKEASDMKREG